MTDLLTTDDVAAMCHTTPATVRYWRHQGRGPAGFRLGRKVVYTASDVEAWLLEKRREALNGAA